MLILKSKTFLQIIVASTILILAALFGDFFVKGAEISGELHLLGIESLEEEHLLLVDGTRQVVRRYRLSFDHPHLLPTDDFELDGIFFEFLETNRVESGGPARRSQTIERYVQTQTSDINEIRAAINETYQFDYQGFAGELRLNHESLATEALPAVAERRTMRDTRTYHNISFGDISQVARSVTRNGVSMTLSNIEWRPVSAAGIDGHSVASHYNAIAHYEGHYSRTRIPGFITTLTYSGYVEEQGYVPDIIYEVVFTAASPASDYNPDYGSEYDLYEDEQDNQEDYHQEGYYQEGYYNEEQGYEAYEYSEENEQAEQYEEPEEGGNPWLGAALLFVVLATGLGLAGMVAHQKGWVDLGFVADIARKLAFWRRGGHEQEEFIDIDFSEQQDEASEYWGDADDGGSGQEDSQ